MKKSKIYIIETLGEVFTYKTLSKADKNHNLGASLHTLYRYDFDESDYENDVCTIKKRWAE